MTNSTPASTSGNVPELVIGSRGSELALWQTNLVKSRLESFGIKSRIELIKTEGDKVLDTPLPLMGGKGVFTKALDDALLAGRIHLAVHSLKDVPTVLPDGIRYGAILERADFRDVLVTRKGLGLLNDSGYKGLIATGSPRRAAQWLRKFPDHSTTDIRGNVPTRLRQVEESQWDGAIFAAAGLKRLGLEQHISQYLDWMLPAPAQGAVCVVCGSEDDATYKALTKLNHLSTALCTTIERQFLNRLEAGCSAPVGALAELTQSGTIRFKGAVYSRDGATEIMTEQEVPANRAEDLGVRMADVALENGASKLVG